MSHTAYRYRVLGIRKVVDGDTVDASLDVGFYMTTTLRFRLVGVDAPERGQPGAAEAKAFVENWLFSYGPSGLVAHTRKADSFGRWLADIVNEQGESLSAALLEAGHAQPYTR